MTRSSSTLAPSSATFLTREITQELTQEHNLIRIKKLLVYACTQTWENHPDTLDRLNLQEWLEKLLEIAPTLEQLQAYLHQAASSLNKPTEYILVANTMTNCFSKHLVNPECTQTIAPIQTIYQGVAQTLTQDQEQIRIKKLLLLASQNFWEKDSSKLDQIDMLGLVQDFHRIAPSPESLRGVLVNLVKTLSKPAEYAAIADKIRRAFQPLYSEVASGASVSTELAQAATTLVRSLPPREAVNSEAAQALSKLIDYTESRTSAEQQPLSQAPSIQPPLIHPPSTQTPSIQPAQQTEGVRSPAQEINWFALRLEIMQYTNPFRAKILLFSVLHESFRLNSDHDSMLKNDDLDDLMQKLMQTYRQFSEVEQQFKQAIRTLECPEEYPQVANTILRMIQPIYANLSTLLPSPSEQGSHSTELINVRSVITQARQS